jgi:hypothetical protein
LPIRPGPLTADASAAAGVRDGFCAGIVSARSDAVRLAVSVRHETFEREHAAAPKGLPDGDRDIGFPHGTSPARVRHGARCRPPP